ncbi:phage integrase family protein [Burkholderia pseudomallei PB08298010]|nr:phage integrase family protein [Burkholderia pseudomallei PB08298010]
MKAKAGPLSNPPRDANLRGRNDFDYSRLGLSSSICAGLQRAMVAELGHTALDTQKRAFYGLRLLAESLRDAGLTTREIFPADVGHIFTRWLDASNRQSSAQWYLRTVIRLLKWCQRNTPEIMSERATFVLTRIRSPSSAEHQSIAEDMIKRILKACYDDIEGAEAMCHRGRRLRTGEGLLPDETQIHELVRELLVIGEGFLPTQRLIHRSGHSYARRIDEIGGQRATTDLLWPSPRSIFPFYLAILIQVSGNPESVRLMKRECIRSHPLRSDLEFLVWEKGRSFKEQHAEFPKDKAWSAPNLVRRLRAMTDELVGIAIPEDRERLFICHYGKERVTKVISREMCHLLDEFIERHGFSRFTLKDLRPATAKLFHRAGKSIEVVQQRLNHGSVRTSTIYSGLDSLADEHESTVFRFQGKLIKLGLDSLKPAKDIKRRKTRASDGADTVFGFRCVDPLAGIAPGSRRGEPCLHFEGCATCPGSVVPLDDVRVVARLLESYNALNEARERATKERWLKRYNMLYENTRVIILQDILPAVHPKIIELAKTLVQSRLVPHLE